ncbi:cell division protein ZapA [Acetobacteraceae bacterium]|nr:cell division protein ZapA [Acetobacteraceae bacterium]
MAKKVELLINGSPYSVWCKEEDETKICRLGTTLEERTSKVARTLRPDSEAHALFLTSLLLLSEIETKALKEKDEADKVAQEVLERGKQAENDKKEIASLKEALARAENQIRFLADRAEKTLAEVKENLQKAA